MKKGKVMVSPTDVSLIRSLLSFYFHLSGASVVAASVFHSSCLNAFCIYQSIYTICCSSLCRTNETGEWTHCVWLSTKSFYITIIFLCTTTFCCFRFFCCFAFFSVLVTQHTYIYVRNVLQRCYSADDNRVYWILEFYIEKKYRSSAPAWVKTALGIIKKFNKIFHF